LRPPDKSGLSEPECPPDSRETGSFRFLNLTLGEIARWSPRKRLLTAPYLVVHSIGMATTSRPGTRGPATTDSDNWGIQFRKGCLELAILAALSGGRLYGLEILRRLEASSNLIVSEGTIYPLLSRLKSEGVLDSEWVESEAGHPRKYYRLTSAGRRRAAAMAKMWSEFSSNLANLVSPLLRETR
jgi:PadR family transcriptional regulator PadR